mgnify:CR=1 FL=1
MIVYSIVVTYNGAKWIDDCLRSLINSDILNHNIIVIDNCSNDNTVKLIKSHYPTIEVIENQKNLGFGKANNIGIQKALKNNADYVFLLNQDAWVNYDTIKRLIEFHIKNPEYGILSPVHLSKDYSIESDFLKYSKESNKLISDALRKNENNDIYEVPFVNAAAWLLPINTIKKVGGFMPIFTHYGEDNNYCNRVLFNKMKIGITPGIFVIHDRNRGEKISLDKYCNKIYVIHLNIITNINDNTYNKIYKLLKMFVLILINNKSNPIFLLSLPYTYLKMLFSSIAILNQYKKSKKVSHNFLDII